MSCTCAHILALDCPSPGPGTAYDLCNETINVPKKIGHMSQEHQLHLRFFLFTVKKLCKLIDHKKEFAVG